MGRDGSLYQVAWWYPRMAVYDDVTGWQEVHVMIRLGDAHQHGQRRIVRVL